MIIIIVNTIIINIERKETTTVQIILKLVGTPFGQIDHITPHRKETWNNIGNGRSAETRSRSGPNVIFVCHGD